MTHRNTSSLRVPNLIMTVGAALAVAHLLAWAVLGCPPPKAPVDGGDSAADAPAPGPSDPEAGFEDADGARPRSACRHACEAMRRFGCPEGAPLDGGDSCEAVCEHAESSGKFALKPACIADAGSRDAVRACGTVRCLTDAGAR